MATFDDWKHRYTSADNAATDVSDEWVEYADQDLLLEFLQFIGRQQPKSLQEQRMLHALLTRLLRRMATHPSTPSAELTRALIETYGTLKDFSGRYLFLQLVAQCGGEDGVRQLADVLATAPPADTAHVAQLLSPLLQPQRRPDLRLLFPRILDAIEHVSTAAAVLDVANFATRHKIVPGHPAADRSDRLAAMLGDLALRLQRLEESYSNDPEIQQKQKRQIDESVPLVVSLCDTLALLGEPRHIGMLNRALSLRHRRVQTEAAAALARLGDEAGEKRLIELAAAPVARLRVLTYADELGILEKIGPHLRTDAARAEASLALWLAEPSQLGFPPSSLTLIDQRELYWPGYDEPVECFLFRFEYELGAGRYSNVGIAGPLTHAFAASLEDLPPDDIYAAFAGWHAEHAYIREQSASDPDVPRGTIDHLVAKLEAEGYSQIEPLTIASFFDDRVLIANATKNERRGVAVVDDETLDWWPGDLARRPIGEFEAYCIYKGRRLLAAFN